MCFILTAIIMPLVFLVWSNPKPPHLWNGDSDMPKYAPLCSDVLKVGNLRELTEAVDTLMVE